MSLKLSHVATDTLVTHGNSIHVTARLSTHTQAMGMVSAVSWSTASKRHHCLEDAFQLHIC